MANGKLDTSQLVQIDGEPGDLLRRDAASYWNQLQKDFRRDMGFSLQVREAYRPLGVQIGYFVTRYQKTSRKTGLWYDGSYWVKKSGVAAAALPGTSKHGDGLAVDVNVDSFTSKAYQWLAKNAGRYGFGNAQGRADGEPWHWVFGETRPSITPAALNTEEINDMSAEAERQINALYNYYAPGIEGKHFDMEAVTRLKDIQREVHAIWDTILPGIEGVKVDGKAYETIKWALWTSQDAVKRLAEIDGVDEDALAKALAPQLAPLISTGLGQTSNEDLAKIKADVLAEAAKRLGTA